MNRKRKIDTISELCEESVPILGNITNYTGNDTKLYEKRTKEHNPYTIEIYEGNTHIKNPEVHLVTYK
jgi:hypothetical protein